MNGMSPVGLLTFDEARALEELPVPSLSFAFRVAIVCRRCNRPRDCWPAGERCCTWWGGYRGRHRRSQHLHPFAVQVVDR